MIKFGVGDFPVDLFLQLNVTGDANEAVTRQALSRWDQVRGS
ncbi:MAG: hypothetical protein WCP28_13455 [Actinomycetes bacterium]